MVWTGHNLNGGYAGGQRRGPITPSSYLARRFRSYRPRRNEVKAPGWGSRWPTPGRKGEAVREGLHGTALDPTAKDAVGGPYDQCHVARIDVLVGEHEKALDQLEQLVKIPYYVSAGW